MAADQNMDPGQVTGTYIDNVTLEGFKSYGIKAAFDGLHPGLNYIAGPRQKGKSSFLEAVCLVLGLDSRHLYVDEPEKLIFGYGYTSIKKATVSLTLKRHDSGDAITVISLEISPNQRVPVLKVDGEERMADYVKQLLHTLHYDASYSQLQSFSKEDIEYAMLMQSFYILTLLSHASGLGDQRQDIESDKLTYSYFANSLQCEINELNGEKEKLEAQSAKNIELANLEKICIGFEYRKLDFEISKARTKRDSIKLGMQKLKSEKQRLVREEHDKHTTKLRHDNLASSLKNEECLLDIKKKELGRMQEYKQKMELLKQLGQYFAGASSSSAGPELKKTKLEDGKIGGLFTQLSSAIQERYKPMTESQDPEGDKQQRELEYEVNAHQTKVDKLKVDLIKVEAELAQLVLEMKQRDHLSNMKSLDGQIENLVSEVENSEANIERLSLMIEELLQGHSWLKEEINNFQTVGNEAEFQNAYEKAKKDFQVLQAEQNEFDPELYKIVDDKLGEWHATLDEVLSETIPKLEGQLQEFDSKHAPKLEERLLVVNEYFGQILSFLLPGCVARLEKLDAVSIFKGLRIAIDKTKEGSAILFSDMVEQEKWLVMLCVYLALLRSTDSSICLLDMSDTLFDSNSNLKAKFQEMIKAVFQECQFIVTTMNQEEVVDAKSFKLRGIETIVLSEAL